MANRLIANLSNQAIGGNCAPQPVALLVTKGGMAARLMRAALKII